MSSRTRRIVVVEDNEDDVYFVRRALRTASPDAWVQVLNDGRAALAYFAGAAPYADRRQFPLPDVVLLDLKLPYVHGLDVLASIRANPAHHQIPVVVLTSSAEARDRERATALAVNGYLVKPPTPQVLREALDLLSLPPATGDGAPHSQ